VSAAGKAWRRMQMVKNMGAFRKSMTGQQVNNLGTLKAEMQDQGASGGGGVAGSST